MATDYGWILKINKSMMSLFYSVAGPITIDLDESIEVGNKWSAIILLSTKSMMLEGSIFFY